MSRPPKARRFLAVAVAALAVAATGCGSDRPVGPEAGELTVVYAAGSQSAGALLLTVTGGEIQQVESIGGQEVQFASMAGGGVRVVVLGSISTGDLLRIRVPDVARASSYSARLEQVADDATFALIDPAGHVLTIRR